jgi:hypothetical protein
MKIDALMGADYIKRSIMTNAAEHMRSVSTEQKDKNTLEAIRKETIKPETPNKGKKIDMTA